MPPESVTRAAHSPARVDRNHAQPMRERIVHIPSNPVALFLPREILPSGHFLVRELRLRLQRNRALFLVRANQPDD